MGKKDIQLTYEYTMHQKVTKWLTEHANITSVENVEYNDDGNITIHVPIDDVTYQKYLK
jgi:DNA-nicking Smr family endonuclease